MHKTILVDAALAKLKGTHCKIMVVLQGHANAARQCWPSTRTIAAKAELSTTTVRKAIAEMESLGYLECRKRGRRNSTLYILAASFAAADDKIATLGQRKQRKAVAPAPLLDLAIGDASESTIDSLSESDRTALSESAADSEVLHLKDSLPIGSAATEDGAASPPIALPSIWPNAIAYLGKHGVAARRARGLVASWRRDHGDGAALDALAAAEAAGASDPVSFVSHRLLGGHHASHRPRRPQRRSFAAVMFEASQRLAERDAEPRDRDHGDGALDAAG